MLKKFCFSAFLISLGCLAFSGDLSSYSLDMSSEEGEKALRKIESKYESQGSAEDGVMTLKFKIRPVTLGYDDTGHYGEIVHAFYTARKCSMIKIDENWLMGSAYCFNFPRIEEEKSWTFDGTTTKYIKGLEIDGEKVTSIYNTVKNAYEDSFENVYKNVKKDTSALPLYINGETVLLYVGNNKKLKEKYSKLPKANIYIPLKAEDSATELSGLNFYVSRKSVVWGVREKQQREIGEYCNGTKCIKLKFGFWNAEAMTGDPLFAVAPNNMEFIVAFNTGDYKTEEDQKRSRYFKEFSEATYKELEKVISEKDPDAWVRIKKKTAHKHQSFIIKK